MQLLQAGLSGRGYLLYANFASVSGLHRGDAVTIAGVKVGEVESIELADYQARVAFRIEDDVKIYPDAVVFVQALGLIGDRAVSIDPGKPTKPLQPGAEIVETRSARDLTELLGSWLTGDFEFDD